MICSCPLKCHFLVDPNGSWNEACHGIMFMSILIEAGIRMVEALWKLAQRVRAKHCVTSLYSWTELKPNNHLGHSLCLGEEWASGDLLDPDGPRENHCRSLGKMLLTAQAVNSFTLPWNLWSSRRKSRFSGSFPFLAKVWRMFARGCPEAIVRQQQLRLCHSRTSPGGFRRWGCQDIDGQAPVKRCFGALDSTDLWLLLVTCQVVGRRWGWSTWCWIECFAENHAGCHAGPNANLTAALFRYVNDRSFKHL